MGSQLETQNVVQWMKKNTTTTTHVQSKVRILTTELTTGYQIRRAQGGGVGEHWRRSVQGGGGMSALWSWAWCDNLLLKRCEKVLLKHIKYINPCHLGGCLLYFKMWKSEVEEPECKSLLKRPEQLEQIWIWHLKI